MKNSTNSQLFDLGKWKICYSRRPCCQPFDLDGRGSSCKSNRAMGWIWGRTIPSYELRLFKDSRGDRYWSYFIDFGYNLTVPLQGSIKSNWCRRCTFASPEDAWCAFDFRSVVCYHASAHYSKKTDLESAPMSHSAIEPRHDELEQLQNLLNAMEKAKTASPRSSEKQMRKSNPWKSKITPRTVVNPCRQAFDGERTRSYLISTFRLDSNSIINVVNTSESKSVSVISPEWNDDTTASFERSFVLRALAPTAETNEGFAEEICQKESFKEEEETSSTVDVRELSKKNSIESPKQMISRSNQGAESPPTLLPTPGENICQMSEPLVQSDSVLKQGAQQLSRLVDPTEVTHFSAISSPAIKDPVSNQGAESPPLLLAKLSTPDENNCGIGENFVHSDNHLLERGAQEDLHTVDPPRSTVFAPIGPSFLQDSGSVPCVPKSTSVLIAVDPHLNGLDPHGESEPLLRQSEASRALSAAGNGFSSSRTTTQISKMEETATLLHSTEPRQSRPCCLPACLQRFLLRSQSPVVRKDLEPARSLEASGMQDFASTGSSQSLEATVGLCSQSTGKSNNFQVHHHCGMDWQLIGPLEYHQDAVSARAPPSAPPRTRGPSPPTAAPMMPPGLRKPVLDGVSAFHVAVWGLPVQSGSYHVIQFVSFGQ